MKFDKDEIKNSLTIDQIEDIVADLGGEPQNHGEYLVCKTICHGGDSHKLYYYDNTKLFAIIKNSCVSPEEKIQKISSLQISLAYFDVICYYI